ncbi:unnamed protein product [Arabidopsis halleri]
MKRQTKVNGLRVTSLFLSLLFMFLSDATWKMGLYSTIILTAQ